MAARMSRAQLQYKPSQQGALVTSERSAEAMAGRKLQRKEEEKEGGGGGGMFDDAAQVGGASQVKLQVAGESAVAGQNNAAF